MAVIKCKMCGGDLALVEGQSIAECEYCGTVQTVPAADNEKKLTLFARANRLRAACEFDKAAGIYEAIVAEFPQEAESYWGLVLCKYGIEYVDDPATGKKIPTCHRSSFDSVMDDSNFGQALENADISARRVYREEAKQIEELRKGIIAVSSREEPYDIFICYKETDANGDRTLDSVLAQDIYDALTARDYRVFFSRITLEDRLGQEYEPYIFAALNSARIMLAVGTDYEHYNAVWVKNEWSRYLKLMTADKSKHLIPCYKGIDAYDMPKEFVRLQAQDLGKVGAMQDLMRGIEKLLPREKSVSVVREQVVVGTGGENKLGALLDRGNMALEDGDWAKADSFFEDVLNNDAKNAQAYLGKLLVQEQCRTLDAFIRKRKDATRVVLSQKVSLPREDAHINQMVALCSIPGYAEEAEIRKLYEFDLLYSSELAIRQEQLSREEELWRSHKLLSRAEKFAAGAAAESLQTQKTNLFAELNARVKAAEQADGEKTGKLRQAYKDHIAAADEKARKMNADGSARREKEYKFWSEISRKDSNIGWLDQAYDFFVELGDYQDSKEQAEFCRKRIDELVRGQRHIGAVDQAKAAPKWKFRENQEEVRSGVVVPNPVPDRREIDRDAIYRSAMALSESDKVEDLENAIMKLYGLGTWNDADTKIPELNARLEALKKENLQVQIQETTQDTISELNAQLEQAQEKIAQMDKEEQRRKIMKIVKRLVIAYIILRILFG